VKEKEKKDNAKFWTKFQKSSEKLLFGPATRRGSKKRKNQLKEKGVNGRNGLRVGRDALEKRFFERKESSKKPCGGNVGPKKKK